MPVMEQYKKISKAIKAKKTERDDCAPLHLFKKHELTLKISVITEEIDDQKSEKAMLISRLACADDNEVRAEVATGHAKRASRP